MVRPRKCRQIRISRRPGSDKPQGISMRQLQVAALKDGRSWRLYPLRTARWADHEAAAALMKRRPSTFSRILAQARRTVATALTEGAALQIGGGDFQLVSDQDAAGTIAETREEQAMNKAETTDALPPARQRTALARRTVLPAKRNAAAGAGGAARWGQQEVCRGYGRSLRRGNRRGRRRPV